ncbi:hypothetical protein RISK_004353 [Rhodopirellula islandica]|uniref:Uncharacterized protein n=1 Tax=Rhodopirellula islandica TaxID=595434 RepID=A0A0J1BAT8_RHOIS|nr:hypothetical protein RISK_004353 [Rhodopirellula islandica]
MRRLSHFLFQLSSFVAVQNASPSRSSSPLFKMPGVERRVARPFVLELCF